MEGACAATRERHDNSTDRVRLPLQFDVGRMQADLVALKSAEWIDHFVGQNYDGDWTVLPLRGPASATHPVMMSYSDPTCTEFADTRFLDGLRYLPTVLRSIPCPVRSARLMKLAPGSRIREHRDVDLSVTEGTARLHLAVETNDGVRFMLNGTRVVVKEGDCWYLRLSDPHSVENRGDSDRVHLVVDVAVNEWLEQQVFEVAHR